MDAFAKRNAPAVLVAAALLTSALACTGEVKSGVDAGNEPAANGSDAGGNQDAGGTDAGTVTPTPVGTPTGPEITAVIGADGGTLTSADGGVVLMVPAGAVSSDTTFRIQAITNEAPGGIGDAYRFTPDGATFAIPVQLRFVYSASDLAGTSPGFLGIAWQDASQHWNAVEPVQRDGTAQTLTVSVSHFTDYARWHGWSLVTNFGEGYEPAQSALLPYDWGLTFGVQYCPPLAPYVGDCLLANDAYVEGWTTDPAGAGEIVGLPGKNPVRYYAPGIMPNPQPVDLFVGFTPPGESTKGLTSSVWVIPSKFVGTSTTTGTDSRGVSVTCNVSATFFLPPGFGIPFGFSGAPPQVPHLAAGTATFSASPCSVSPDTFAFDSTNGSEILVDYSPMQGGGPATWSGKGLTTWSATLTCNGKTDPNPYTVYCLWLPPLGQLNGLGDLSGTFKLDPSSSITYDFAGQ